MYQHPAANNKQLSETQKAYVNNGIAKGLEDMKDGRGLSDPAEIEADIMKRFNKKKAAYLSALKAGNK